MSGIKTYMYTAPIDIQTKILEIDDILILCLDRKLEKLNILLKHVDVYMVNDNLIVHDKYNTLFNFKEVANAFGMDVKEEIVTGLKGKTYILGDEITKLLTISEKSYNFGKILNIKELKNEININPSQLFNYANLDIVYDDELKFFLNELKESGGIVVEDIGSIVEGIIKTVESSRNEITGKLKKYLNNIEKQVSKNNEYLQKGTTELIYNRARQMGYSVKKEIKNKQVQLVLVRTE